MVWFWRDARYDVFRGYVFAPAEQIETSLLSELRITRFPAYSLSLWKLTLASCDSSLVWRVASQS
jgi:hypothetical protein